MLLASDVSHFAAIFNCADMKIRVRTLVDDRDGRNAVAKFASIVDPARQVYIDAR